MIAHLLGVLVASVRETGHGRRVLGFPHQDLTFSVLPLALCLGSVCSSVIMSASDTSSCRVEDEYRGDQDSGSGEEKNVTHLWNSP